MYPEHAPILAPLCALGANNGAIIMLSAAAKVCTVLCVDVLIAANKVDYQHCMNWTTSKQEHCDHSALDQKKCLFQEH
jgi:hypothetical protein